MTNNWICAQMGAREHYAIPRAASHNKQLRCLVTDYWANPETTSNLSGRFLSKKLAGKYHSDLRSASVVSFNNKALIWLLKQKISSRRLSTYQKYQSYCEIGGAFARKTAEFLPQLFRDTDHPVFFGYDTASLEAMQAAKALGAKCILGQIDPCKTEIDLVRDEQKIWTGWSDATLDVPEMFFQRHRLEWEISDLIIVNSDFSKTALINQGVSHSKLVVVPLSFEPDNQVTSKYSPEVMTDLKTKHFSKNRPLRVLFLGQVMLRKGIQYLMEAARKMESLPIAFEVVGPIHISQQAINKKPQNLNFHGSIARSQVADWYRWADVFILPTLSDGFAITQIEAMSYGLPLITTRNCGSVVQNGVNGFTIGERSPKAIEDALTRYLDDNSLRSIHAQNALERAKDFSLHHLSENLGRVDELLRN